MSARRRPIATGAASVAAGLCACCGTRSGELPLLVSTDPPRHDWWCWTCYQAKANRGVAR